MPSSSATRFSCRIPARRAAISRAATRVFVCHDYKPGGREARCETTIADERASNIHVKDGTSEADFTAMRRKRDATLEMPALIYPAVQFNIRGGRPPPAEPNGRVYLKMPFAGPAK